MAVLPAEPSSPRFFTIGGRFRAANVAPEESMRRAAITAGSICQRVVTRLARPIGANVKVTIEVDARMRNGGVPDVVAQMVTENSRMLWLAHYRFEERWPDVTCP
jgi:hypothetical protein